MTTLTKMTGRYEWKTHYIGQARGAVFAVTRHDFDMPVRSTAWRMECSRPELLRGHGRWIRRDVVEFDTLADARSAFRDIATEGGAA